jgi:hypothetical protein
VILNHQHSHDLVFLVRAHYSRLDDARAAVTAR